MQPPERSPRFPRIPGVDSTLALLTDGYEFVSRRCERYGTDVFETRLMLRKVTCARGADAAAMFYHPGRFTRRGAMPTGTVMLLQNLGSVQQLDGEAHRQRKQLFLHLLDAESTARLVGIFRAAWRRQAAQWTAQASIVLRREVELILCRAACRWAGVPLSAAEAPARARALASMVGGAGSFGPALLRGWLERERTERWIRGVIRRLRAEDGAAAAATPAGVLAAWRDARGRRLSTRIAAVELINLLRPIVAVTYWIVFAALALHRYPELRRRLQAGEPGLLLNFAQEVRRFYPFFPFVAGHVREPFTWRGRRFGRGEWVLLDLYATDHDPRRWTHPGRFDPDRFRDRPDDAFDFVAQGGGDAARGHRCPGENPSIALLMTAIGELAMGLSYDVPPQDLRYRRDRLPTLPASGFVMARVRTARDNVGGEDRPPRRAAAPARASLH